MLLDYPSLRTVKLSIKKCEFDSVLDIKRVGYLVVKANVENLILDIYEDNSEIIYYLLYKLLKSFRTVSYLELNYHCKNNFIRSTLELLQQKKVHFPNLLKICMKYSKSHQRIDDFLYFCSLPTVKTIELEAKNNITIDSNCWESLKESKAINLTFKLASISKEQEDFFVYFFQQLPNLTTLKYFGNGILLINKFLQLHHQLRAIYIEDCSSAELEAVFAKLSSYQLIILKLGNVRESKEEVEKMCKLHLPFAFLLF